jgi:hypothetical protein
MGSSFPAEARFCPASAAPLGGRPEPAEERKLATVLFADLVGSTELAGSQVASDELREQLGSRVPSVAAEGSTCRSAVVRPAPETDGVAIYALLAHRSLCYVTANCPNIVDSWGGQ